MTEESKTEKVEITIPLYLLLDALVELSGDEYCNFRDAIIWGVYEAMVQGARVVSYEVSPLGQKVKDVKF